MKSIRTSLCGLLLTGATAWAGTFTANFATPDTSTFYINGAGTLSDTTPWMPFISTNRLHLTLNQNNLHGSFSPIDFDGGATIQAFTAAFKLQFGPGTANAADGASFSFGPDIVQDNVSYDEVGAGGTAMAVSFHTYTSNGGPAVDVYVHGTRIGHFPMAKGDMVNSQLQDVLIQLNPNSTLNISYRGQVVVTNLYLPDWGPTHGFFIINGRTGGENEETDIGNVSINTTLYTTPVAPSFTSTPTNVTVAEGGSASFTATFGGTGPFQIQWLQRGNPIPGATSQTLTMSPVYYADNNSAIAVQITAPGGTLTSPAATLTVIRDVTAPTVVSATADKSFTSVLVKYSEPVSDTAVDPSRYTLDQGAMVTAVNRIDASTVQLTTTQLAEATGYNLVINGVQDMATTPNTIAANTTIHFQTFQFAMGTVVHQKYTGFDDNAGSNPDNLFNDPRFPNQPNRRDLLGAFEYPAGGQWYNSALDSDKLFFDTMDGYFIPPTNGNYVFFIAFSDRGWLFLSTDDNPANKVMVAGTTGWSDPRSWLSSHDYDTNLARSDRSANNLWPGGNTITLEAGKRYYMMMVHHMPDWAGGSWCDATYKLDTDPDPANGTPSTLVGNVIASYIDPTGTSVSFTEQPQNASIQQGRSATFSGAATGVSPYGASVNYQWQTAPAGSSTWTNIPGATSAIFQTPLMSLADNGRQYRLVATVAPVSLNSTVATLTVSTDTAPPVPTVGALLDVTSGTVDVGVGFDETIDPTTVGVLANYTVSPGTITGITVYTNRFTSSSHNPLVMSVKQSVLLTVTGLSGSGTLTIKNLSDTYGNKITSTVVPFSVDTARKWGVVGGNEFGGINGVVPVGANGFDVYSDSVGEWAAYDEATFVYEQVTGDFDKKVRVQYQDGSSQWSRAGIIARDVTNFGVDRNGQTTNNLAGRYQKCFVTPVGATLTGPGTGGAQEWETNRRLLTGGQTDGAPVTPGANSIPQYPNAWCRLQRVGQTFNLFRSDDGVNWIKLGSTTFGVDGGSTPMPNTLYVGPEFAPEVYNITSVADRGTFLAQFRSYGDFTTIFDPQLKIKPDATGRGVITWTVGTLVSSPTLNGTYTPVGGAASPYTIPASTGTTFYRVMQ